MSLDTTITQTALPRDLDNYLLNAESGYSDLTAGAEKKIVWADEVGKHKTDIVFIYLHGFSATRQESEPVPANIAKHFKANIFYARLAGNGRSDDALAQGSVTKWVNDAAQAMAIAERIGRRTVLIGCSTGATLAWWVANQPQYSKQLAALILFSPNFGVADPRAGLLLYPWGAQIAKRVVGNYQESEPVNELHARYWTNRYPTEALLPMMGIVKLASTYLPPACKWPVHITYSLKDETISVEKIKGFFHQLPGPKKEALEIIQPEDASKHVVVGDILAPENTDRVTQSIIEFLQKYLVSTSG